MKFFSLNFCPKKHPRSHSWNKKKTKQNKQDRTAKKQRLYYFKIFLNYIYFTKGRKERNLQ